MTARPKVIHFVTGGGSGATRVALELACGHLRTGGYEPLFVLRRKRVPLPAPMQAQIDSTGLRTAWVDSGSKRNTLRQLAAIIAEFQPEIFVAHGNSEHLWGRQAAFTAGVPVVLHVEHNRERYFFWRRWAAQRLALRTSATVCVSRGVATYVQSLGLDSPRLEIIPNGVDVARFAAEAPPLASRPPDIVMAARFARQKDQPTLIRAVKRLVESGWKGRLLLAGSGRPALRRACEKLAQKLGVQDRVEFLGQVGNPAALYQRCRAAVLSTNREGLPLAIVESMAAGCAAVSSNIPGVTDIIDADINGWLFPRGDDEALARILTKIMDGDSTIEDITRHGQMDALERFSLERMLSHYEALFQELTVNR